MSLKFLNPCLMKAVILFLFILFFSSGIYGQNLIGSDEAEIKKYMKENRIEFKLQNDKNNYFKYLKYVNNTNTETLIFFLSNKYICNGIRLICDQNLKNQKLKELDLSYTKEGSNLWSEKKKNKNYVIELTDEEWFFSINIKLKE